jgi:2-haloacid dehalogenase
LHSKIENEYRSAAVKKLTGIRACVFDAYGTVFDLASATARCADIPANQRAALTTLWRDKQLQYTWLRSLQGHYADFERVTGDALDFSLETLGLSSAALRDQLMRLFFSLEVFPEVEGVLKTLRERGFKTAILSNGTPKMLEALLTKNNLAGLFDEVISVESVKVFKTHPRVYGFALEKLGLEAHEICFQSSNAWDAYAASAFGMRVVWCNRYAQRRERLPGAPDFEVKTLSDLPNLISRDA